MKSVETLEMVNGKLLQFFLYMPNMEFQVFDYHLILTRYIQKRKFKIQISLEKLNK